MTTKTAFHHFWAMGLIATMAALLTVQMAAAQVLQTSPQSFSADLSNATPGTILEMAPGDYGTLSLRRMGGSTDAPLILRSADPGNPAVIREMTLRDTHDMIFEGILFDHQFEPSDQRHFRPFQLLNSTNITFRNNLFDGDMASGMSPSDDGFPTAFGLGVRDSQAVVFEHNEIRDFFRGLVVSQSRDVTIRHNDMHSIRMDGMNFAEVVNVRIEDNHIHDFKRSLESRDHADMIQFWTNRTDSPSRNIVIRNNVLNSGNGWYTQSIFMRNDMVDRGLSGDEMFYRNILIEGNVILNAHLHGITVGETDGLIIRNNTVVRNATSEGVRDNPPLWVPQIRVSDTSRDVLITANVTSKVVGHDRQADWAVHTNVFVQDGSRIQPGFYGEYFHPDALRDPRNIRAFRPRAGGPLDNTGIGAPRLNDF